MSEADSEEAELPLLSWRAGLADNVVRQIQAAWEGLPERDRIQVHTGAQVTDLGSGSPRRLTWNAPGHATGAGDLHPALRNVFPRGTPEENRLFKLLKHAYVDARYDPKFTITRQELEAIAVHVRELRTRVEKVCRERIQSMGSPPS